MTRRVRLMAVALVAAFALAIGAQLALSETSTPTSKPGYSLPTKRGLSDFGR